ncbi:DUF456 domain-containing protein [Riemerella anatipestifer]|uniref:DUF456 domain-containing protein n=1 Tax=Riemerella anatipestifer TaxID=34085 RepID=UPI00129D4ABB|nr:DUF456 domain-containing protein [Riemerella anatipestifer]MRM83336.1 DUF456 domain-containing protein [Riemerella anatipestifer]
MTTQDWISIISIIVVIIGILGTILPVLPGILLSFAGVLLYKFSTDSNLSMVYIWIFGFFSLASLVLNYLIPAKLNKRYGGTKWGSIGSIIGTLVGFFLPIPFGFLIGMFLGVFIGEMLHDSKNYLKAYNSTKGAFIGFLASSLFNFSLGLAMLFVVLWDYFKNLA